VQGVEGPGRELWDAGEVVGHLVAVGSMFGFLAEHRADVFPDETYADLFAPPGVGRPSLPATRMAAVLTLQALHSLSDRETAEAVRCDLRWKVACGLSLLDEGFDPSSLVYWRRRIADSQRPHRINDAVRQVIEATGVLRGRRRRAVDSTVLDDAVATQDTVTQLIGAIRRVARQVPGAAEVIAAKCRGHDYTQPGKPRIDWTDPQAKQELVSALVTDANAVVAALTGAGSDQVELDETAAAAVALLALVAGQDVEPAEGSDGTDGRWRIARKVAPERVISTVDPEARHAHKTRHRRQDGYKAHVKVEPDTGLITGCALTPAAGAEHSDAAVGIQLLADEPHPVDVLGDSAYGTGELLAAAADGGHTAIIKPWPLRPAVDGGFTLDDFTVDEAAGTVTCPNGLTAQITRTRKAVFGARCRDCPLRARCTSSARGRKLTLHPHDALQRAHRVRAQDPQFQAVYRGHRPMVERSISWLVAGGNRRLRFVGTRRNDLWLHHRAAALNLRRLLTLGLTRSGGTWLVAPA
jgi:hypothetical protein